VPAATADNPPFGAKPWIEPVVALWEPEPYSGRARILAPIVPAAAVDNPPFAVRAWRATVLDSWEPAPYRPQVLTHVVQGQRVDNPPFAVRPWMGTVLAAWQPVPPDQVILRRETEGSAFVPGVFPPDSPLHFRIGLKTVRIGSPNEAGAGERLGSGTINPSTGRLGDEET
jgi:hypothetical protein